VASRKQFCARLPNGDGSDGRADQMKTVHWH
jgi:hypothetical protein